jgi:hypothetical protein
MGGDIQIVLYLIIMQGYVAIWTYFLFVMPLVLLWSAESQIKRWYFMLLLSALWLPIANEALTHDNPARFIQMGVIVLWAEVGAFSACGLYLLLLRRAF